MIKNKLTYDAIIIGAGGAGLMCAATAGQMGKRILVLDHADKIGKKILISGGGRCNFTNLDARPEAYLSQNPHFVKSALARYTQHDFIELVNRYKIAWHEKTLGQLFCDGSAQQIVDLLLKECQAGNVEIQIDCSTEEISKSESGFSVSTSNGEFRSNSLIVATGGPSIPKLGATDFAYKIARLFKLKIIEPRPALVPLTLGKDEALFSELSGVATDTVVRTDKQSFREASLFTHKGLSGPAILQISSYWKPGSPISVNFLPDQNMDWLLEARKASPKAKLKSALNTRLPERLAETLSAKLDSSGKNLADFKDKDLTKFGEALTAWPFNPNGTEGFAKAEVTSGGISTDELSSKTMESKRVPGLYFVGECVDVTGWLGGYNFQWAWSSGFVAGKAIALAR
ncbi:MAG: NAD(P)/FAD-dependent oxidoreductase [Pseudomonadota bacterium]